MNILAFAAASVIGAAYFSFRRRTVDLFAVAYGGCIFYFLPLFVGSVPERGELPTDLMISLPAGIYAVGIGVTASIFVAAALFDRLRLSTSKIDTSTTSSIGLSTWYLLFALIGLFGSIRSGAIFNLDKLIVLDQVGYWFILFETGTALAVADAFLYRMRWHLVVSIILLFVDVFIGFRTITIMTVIACVLLKLGSYGPLQLWRKTPILGLGVAVLFLAMVAVNPFRYAWLPHLEIFSEPAQIPKNSNAELPLAPRINDARPATRRPDEGRHGISEPLADRTATVFTRFLDFQNIEPFVTQAILAKMILHEFSCSPRNILNIAYIVPFAGLIFGAPEKFESEFKPALFPNYKYGLAGNIWAETFCRFGYLGIVSAVIIFILSIAVMQILLFRAFPIALPALALSGVFLAFYVHRNDLLFELLLIRRVLLVFGVAWLLEVVWSKIAPRLDRRVVR